MIALLRCQQRSVAYLVSLLLLAASFVVGTAQAQNGSPPTTVVELEQSTLDSDSVAGPRFLRVNFDALSSASHNVSVAWDSAADVRFNVIDETTGSRLNSGAVQGNNPGVFTADLIGGQPYSIRAWSFSGVAIITASIEASVPLGIQQQPVDLSVTEGDTATFSVEASGSGVFTYQWFANGVPLTGETTDSLTLVGATLADDGTAYTVDVSNGLETLNSDVATLSVEQSLRSTVVVVGQSLLDSTNTAGPRFLRIDFDALATGPHTVSVAWDSNADVRFNVFDETTGNRINASLVQGVNPGEWTGDLVGGQTYSIRMWSSSGTANVTASIEASVPLGIEQQPADLTVTEGDAATFAVLASGSGTYTYQWFANGSPLVGETADTLSLASTTLLDNGNVYTVDVSNGAEMLSSDPATLVVEAAPSITIASQPVDVTIIENDDATFTVVASGTGTLSYQWFADDVAIANATSNTLVVSAAALAASGTVYTVAVTDDNQTLLSSGATLTVEPTPPPTSIVVVGESLLDSTSATGPRFLRIDFDALTTGPHTVSVAWDSSADVRFNVFDETTGSRLNASLVQGVNPGEWTGNLNDGQPYSIRMWSSTGIANVTASIEASVPLGIEQQPVDLTVTDGDAATFTVLASGSGTFTYQWFANGSALVGETADTLTLATTSLLDDGNVYTVDVSNGAQTLSSNAATLVVEAAPSVTITSQPVDATIIENEDATFSVVASGTGSLSYQWFADDVAIANATSSTYVVSAAALAASGTVYSVEITDDTQTLLSSGATLTVEPTPLPTTSVVIGEPTLDADSVAGPRFQRINFNALATSSHTVTVAWDSDADVRFNVFDEATGNQLNSSTIQDNNPGVWTGDLIDGQPYSVRMWSVSGIANVTASIEAIVPITILSQPENRLVTEGGNASFFIEATGSGVLTYQWFENGNLLAGETSDSLTVLNTTLAADGSMYTVDISNGVMQVSSDIAFLTVNATPVLGVYSSEVDATTWSLAGPAPTLDFNNSRPGDAWGRRLLRIGDLLLVGGDFTGIVERPFHVNVTATPFLTAFDAVTGQPVSSFQVPPEIDSVVRALVLSPNGEQVYVGGDFGVVVLDAVTGDLDFSIAVADGAQPGRVFDIAVTDSHLYIGGDFSNVNGSFRANIARLSLGGVLDTSWTPDVTNGFSSGRAAPVQAITLSPLGDVVYVGGNFAKVDGTPVPLTDVGFDISLLPLSALDGAVLPERFIPFTNVQREVLVHDIAVTDNHVIISWGGPNILTFHSHDGTRLQQYRGKGDIQALEVVGNNVLVGHHGEFFGFLPNPIPLETLTDDPEVFVPHRLHVFRLDTPDFAPGQAFITRSPFGIWGIAATEDAIWVTGQIEAAGTNEFSVDGLARFPALD